MRIRPPQLLAVTVAATAVLAVFCPRPGDPPARKPAPPGSPPGKCTEEVLPPLPREALLRLPAKRLVIRDVAAGRLTLPEAAALFRDLDRLPPATVYPEIGGPDSLRARTEEERLCRRVTEFARQSPEDVPEGFVARLESELDRRLGSPDGLRLPDDWPSMQELLDRADAAMLSNRQARSGGPGSPPDP